MSDHLDAAALAHSMLAQAMAKPKYTAKDNAEHWRRIANERREAGLEGAARDAEQRAKELDDAKDCPCGGTMLYERGCVSEFADALDPLSGDGSPAGWTCEECGKFVADDEANARLMGRKVEDDA